MRIWYLILVAFFFSCNDPQPKSESAPAEKMSFGATLPTGEKYDILANGDSIFYKTKDSVVSVPYSFKVNYTEIRPKSTTPPPVNIPPTARAGADFTVTIPAIQNTASFKLDASGSTDPEGGVLKFFWRKTAGNVITFTDTNKVIATVSNATEGVYTFEVRAVDPLNAFTPDFITVTVKKEVIAPPVGSIVPFSFTKNTAFKPRKFSGTENWNGQYYTSFTGGYQDYYFRFCWTDIEKNTQGNYVWTRFDQEFQKALNVKGKFSFGIMTVCDSDDFLAQEFFNGISSRYPKYVHDRMQTESVKDYTKNNQWIPNWNSTFFLDRFDALLKAIQAHIVSKGWQDKINYVDIRGYGQWGGVA